MNRPIKFRARFHPENEWREMTLKEVANLLDAYHNYDCWSQFTGLKDKNGVEIYEGDIVDAWSQGQNAKCEVKWGQGPDGFFLYRQLGGIAWNLSGGGPDYTEETVEVIGNIYENPELLEAKQ